MDPSSASTHQQQLSLLHALSAYLQHQQQLRLLHALASRDLRQAAQLCTPQEVGKCGPGNLSALMVALLVGADHLFPRLLAAGAPVDVKLTLSRTDSQLDSWLVAAGLGATNNCRLLLCGSSAMDLALRMGKYQQACSLVEAGAALSELLVKWHYGSWNPYAKVNRHVLAYYTRPRLAAASPQQLCQLTRLSLLMTREHTISPKEILEVADRRSLAFDTGDAAQLVLLTAKRQQWQGIALHVVQRCPNSIWPTLVAGIPTHPGQEEPSTLNCPLAKQLFPLLAKQLQYGNLQLPSPASKHLAALVLTAMSYGIVEPCLSALHTAQQQQVALEPEDSFSLLRSAAIRGCTQLAMFLLRATPDSVWRLLDWGGGCLWQGVVPSRLAEEVYPFLVGAIQGGQLRLPGKPQLVLLLRHMVLHNQPNSCLAALHAAQQQHVELSAEEAEPVLKLAAEKGRLGVVMHLLATGGSTAVWQLIHPYTRYGWERGVSPNVRKVLIPHLGARLAAGALPVDSLKLEYLVSCAVAKEPAAAARMLQAAQQQGVQLSSGASEALFVEALALEGPGAQQLINLLLAVQPAFTTERGMEVVVRAALAGNAAVLDFYLKAGASTSLEAVHAATEALSVPCLAMLLRERLPPQVDPSKSHFDTTYVLCGTQYDRTRWTCPIIQLFDDNVRIYHRSKGPALRVLEVLLDAGYMPTTYTAYTAGPCPFPLVFNPLLDTTDSFLHPDSTTAEYFDLGGTNRWLWLAVQQKEWSPATHHMFPERLKAAFKTVLLAMARNQCKFTAQICTPGGPSTASALQHNSCQLFRTNVYADMGLAKASKLLSLPPELLLHVLQLAAKPLSDWVGQPETVY